MENLLNTPLWQMTAGQFLELLKSANEPASKASDDNTSAEPKRFVHGLRGIMELFGVSHTSAQAYKNTWLQPAIQQRGRKIVVDADLAVRLFNERIKA